MVVTKEHRKIVTREEIERLIKAGELEMLSPQRRPSFLKRWEYLRIIEDGQPITAEEITKELRGNVRGVKAFLKKLEKAGDIVAVFYKGREYYLTKEHYQELREEKKK